MWSYSKAVAAIEQLDLAERNLRFAWYWLSLWADGRPPTRAQFDPNKVRNLLPGIALIEVRADHTPICRLAGTAIDVGIGRPLVGANLLDFVSDEGKAVRQSRVTTIVQGSVSLSRTPYRQGDATKFIETIQVPFAGMTDDGARLYMAHTNWRPSDGFAMPPTPSEPLGLPQSFRLVSLH